MCRFPLLLIGLLALSLLGGAVRADDLPPFDGPPVMDGLPTPELPLPPPPVPAGPPVPLSQALATLEPPKQDLFLAVAADKTMPLPDAAPLERTSTGGQAAEAYGQIVRDFGNVLAIAPPTMTVLTTKPGAPAAFEDIPPEEALKLLLGSLSAAQWQELTSPGGLGVSDLFEGSQTAYFAMLFPTGELTAMPQYVPNGSAEPIKLAGEDFRAVRLRLGQKMQIGIPLEGQNGGWQQFSAAQSPDKSRYDAQATGNPPAQDTACGVTLRQTLPNSPKDADLDYRSAALKQTIGLAGVATVGDLIARIGQTAGLEIYADRRLEKRTVTLLGPTTGTARDLLRALAFCLAGTYRRVGPAYVLTNDVLGLAPRQQIIGRFLQKAGLTRRAAVWEAGDRIITAHGVDTLPSLDGLGFSDTQLAQAHRDQDLEYQASPTESSFSLPFDQLTPAQQEFVRQRVQQKLPGTGSGPRLSLSGKFRLVETHVVQLLSSRVPEPITLQYPTVFQLYQPSPQLNLKLWARVSKAREEAAKKSPPPVSVSIPMPSPLPTLASYPRRAVIASPRTAAEVDAVLESMKVVGLNQLWLDVFSGGKSHLEEPKDGTPDILTEALARTKGTSVAVIPMLNLLRWSRDAPLEARDLNFMGERPVAEAYADAWVSPSAPVVQKTLTELVQRLAAMPGVAVLALRDTVAPGYDHPPYSNAGISETDLGYTPEMRLAFLRRAHVDPVDLGTNPYLYGANLNLSLPEFDEAGMFAESVSDWGQFRDGANRDFLKRLLAAGKAAGGPQFRFLVRERSAQSAWNPTWYGLWENAQAPLPEVTPENPAKFDPAHPPWERNLVQLAHTQSRVAVSELLLWGVELTTLMDLTYLVQQLKPGWDGFVIGVVGTLDTHEALNRHPLADLANSLRPPVEKGAAPTVGGRAVSGSSPAAGKRGRGR